MAGTGGITDGVAVGARRAVAADLETQAAALARVIAALDAAEERMPRTPPTWRGDAASAFTLRRDALGRELLLVAQRADSAAAATRAARLALPA
jgi:hypothetical protein